MTKLPFYIEAIQIAAPIIIVLGTLKFLLGFSIAISASDGDMLKQMISNGPGWSEMNRGVFEILIGIVVGAISKIGVLLFQMNIMIKRDLIER